MKLLNIVAALSLMASVASAQEGVEESQAPPEPEAVVHQVEFIEFGSGLQSALNSLFSVNQGGILSFCASDTPGLPACAYERKQLLQKASVCENTPVVLRLVDVAEAGVMELSDMPKGYEEKMRLGRQVLKNRSGNVRIVSLPRSDNKMTAFVICRDELTQKEQVNVLKVLAAGSQEAFQ